VSEGGRAGANEPTTGYKGTPGKVVWRVAITYLTEASVSDIVMSCAATSPLTTMKAGLGMLSFMSAIMEFTSVCGESQPNWPA
jgi:hypothetical protein